MVKTKQIFDSGWSYFEGYLMRDIMRASPRANKLLRQLYPEHDDDGMHSLFCELNYHALELFAQAEDPRDVMEPLYAHTKLEKAAISRAAGGVFRMDFIVEYERDYQVDDDEQLLPTHFRRVTALLPDESEAYHQQLIRMLDPRWDSGEQYII